MTLSERYIAALAELPQFLPCQTVTAAKHQVVHALSGATVTPVPDQANHDHGLLRLRLPGCFYVEVAGYLYLDLMIMEAATHNFRSSSHFNGAVIEEANFLRNHLYETFDL